MKKQFSNTLKLNKKTISKLSNGESHDIKGGFKPLSRHPFTECKGQYCDDINGTIYSV